MIPNRVPLGNDSAQEFRVLLNILSAHEERCRNALLAEDVEDLRGKRRRRPVVKGQSNALAVLRASNQNGAKERGSGSCTGPPKPQAKRQSHCGNDEQGGEEHGSEKIMEVRS